MQQKRVNDLVVFITRSEGTCTECGEEFGRGNWIFLDGGKPFCMHCAGLDHLEHLPSGNATLTRRAGKLSPIRAVLVKWSRTRKRYEQQGILVKPAAIQQAEKECESDADVRARQRERAAEKRAALEPVYVCAVTEAIQQQFPGCPIDEVSSIAEWTCEKHSGRVGRSAAAKELDAKSLRLAVVAHVRHRHTPYDEILMNTGDRGLARSTVAKTIDSVLAKWENSHENTESKP